MALLSENFADLLDVRFRRIWDERFTQVKDKLDTFYDFDPGSKPQRQTERYSTIGTLSDPVQFSGTVAYDDIYQGYDVSATPIEWAQGLQIERRLFDTEQHSIIDAKPKALAESIYRLRQTHGARIFNNANSVDTLFASNSEGVALVSNSHTTTSGATTATGFDNLTTDPLSATALTAARIAMVNFRGDRAERIAVMPDMLLIPPDLYDVAFEIVGSRGKPGVATNEASVHYGQYRIEEWLYLTDANNWFLIDSTMMKDIGLKWLDHFKGEFAFVEDFDTFVGKWRSYCVWAPFYIDWRWIYGGIVS